MMGAARSAPLCWSHAQAMMPTRRLARPFRSAPGPPLARRRLVLHRCRSVRGAEAHATPGNIFPRDTLKNAAWHAVLVGVTALSAIVALPFAAAAAPSSSSSR